MGFGFLHYLIIRNSAAGHLEIYYSISGALWPGWLGLSKPVRIKKSPPR
jgi:hypothetical protein